jgi:hypothetical protein
MEERRSPKPRMGVRALPAQRSGTLRGESACTLPTQQWETPSAAGRPRVIRSWPRALCGGRDRNPGLLAQLEERRSCKPEVRGSSPRWSTHARDGMWCKGERTSFGTRWMGFESLLPDSCLFGEIGITSG